MSGGSSARAPRVGVVLLICTEREEAETIECIRSLRETGYGALDVILVDNGAPADVSERLRAALPDVEIISTGENLGFTGGNNLGMTRALERGCDYVLVLNNDTEVEPGCIAALVEAAEQGENVGAVGGKILYFEAPQTIWFGGGVFSPARALGLHEHERRPDPDPESRTPREVTFLTGCCMLFPAAVLREVGLFEDDFFIYVEDVELSFRLRRAGYRLLYHPGARLYHKVDVDEPEIPPHKIVLRDRNRRRLVRRRYTPRERLRFAAFFYPTRMVHALRYIASGDLPRLRAIVRGLTEA